MNKKKKLLIIAIMTIIILASVIVGFLITFFSSEKEHYISEANITIPIFLYHEIVIEKTAEDFMHTTDTVFKEQITGLQNLGYKFIGYDDLIAYHKGEKKLGNKVIILTFDDGMVSNYDTLFPIIKEFNIPITINLIDDQVGTPEHLNWDHIKEMYQSGLVSFYSHGKSHIDATTIDTTLYKDEVLVAHKNIEDQLEKSMTKVYTYPLGLYDDEKISALERRRLCPKLNR